MKTLEDLLIDLQKVLANVDLISQRSDGNNSGFIELLIAKNESLKIKMYQELGHSNPHVHIDYPQKNHSASFTISPAKLINGSVSRNHEATIVSWLNNNSNDLLRIWNSINLGEDVTQLIAEVKAKGFN